MSHRDKVGIVLGNAHGDWRNGWEAMLKEPRPLSPFSLGYTGMKAFDIESAGLVKIDSSLVTFFNDLTFFDETFRVLKVVFMKKPCLSFQDLPANIIGVEYHHCQKILFHPWDQPFDTSFPYDELSFWFFLKFGKEDGSFFCLNGLLEDKI